MVGSQTPGEKRPNHDDAAESKKQRNDPSQRLRKLRIANFANPKVVMKKDQDGADHAEKRKTAEEIRHNAREQSSALTETK